MFVAVREAAKEGPSTGLFRIFRSALPHGSARGSRGHAECREAMGSGLTEVAKDGHGQRKGLAYPQRAGVSSRVKERRSTGKGPPGLNRPNALDMTCHAPRTGSSRCERDE